ncbi:flagellar hook protein FlgK [Thalassobaculum fulvum]|uniref:Flagellar hook-associated protein 1 n=1 Tax=Thalassobaculum fulvum TaxID=1633335 RepID=A0A919CRT9_9PROT|nr:flagellar hook-associated protein FlgK [Thalassobaculum fulvum]GHD60914.1 flagellar hook protein FlgK [Thalassobaculum fulvum]
MSLFDAISTARSGLIATQSAIDVASRNIANASVEGYTRKIQEQSTRVVDGRAGAVKVEEVTRNVNAQLQRDVREQSSVVEELTIIEDFLSRLELEFGRPEDSSSVASKVTELKKAFQSLATNPDQSTAQNDVISAAEELALALTTLSDSIQALRAEADQRIGDSVDSINEALQNIDSLNAEIGARKTLGQSTADLEDKRDVWVQKLSEQMDIRTFERSDGRLAVLTGDSQFLIDQAAVTLTFSPSASVTPGSAVNDIMLDNGYLAPFAITSSFSDGTVAGLVQLRDTLMPLAQDQLDSLAFELAQQFDSVTVGATTADLDLFTDSTNTVPGASAGFSAQIQVRTTLAGADLRDGIGGTFTASGASDSSLPLAIIDMFDTKQAFVAVTGLNSTSSTIEEFAAEFVSYQANQAADYESQLNFQEQIRSLLDERLKDESGVNLDEELASLIQLESAFAASARVLSSVQQALDELLNSVR